MMNHLNLKNILLSIVILGYFLVSPHLFAANISLSVSPTYPGAFSEATVTATSFSTDLNRATITWQVNGETIQSGVGMRAISVKTGAVGASQRIVALVRPSGGSETLRAELVVIPTEVDLLAESNSYIPSAYRGKALFTPGSRIVVTAIPNFIDPAGNHIPPEKLVYQWQRNFQGVGTASGYGKYTFEIAKLKGTGTETIGVDVSSIDGDLRKSASLTIRPAAGRMLFYEDRPLLGTWYNIALPDKITLRENELTLRGEPFGLVSSIGAVLFEWFVGGENTESSPENPRVLTFRTEEGSGAGEARVTLSGDDSRVSGQKVIGALTIRFGNQ